LRSLADQRLPRRKIARAMLRGSARHSRSARPISHEIEGGRGAAQPATRSPARRNSSVARGKCARSLTSHTERPPHALSSRADPRALPTVSRDPGSTSNAASGTSRERASRRMISASGTGPAPPPESSSNGAAPSWNKRTPTSSRRVSRLMLGQPSTTIASALGFIARCPSPSH